MISKFVVGSRGSKLALIQSGTVVEALRREHPDLEVTRKIIKTTGDRQSSVPLTALGGQGAFTKELQQAQLDGTVDVAVHSLKDLPTPCVPGLRLWAYPSRAEPREAWLGRDARAYAQLGAGARVATGSLRRAAQLRHCVPGVQIQPLRGNIETRLAKFRQGTMDGIIVALAALQRLGLDQEMTEALSPETFLPAPGQGALAVEGRDEPEIGALLAPLDDPDTRVQVTAERAFLARLQGGCQVPVAALAQRVGQTLVLTGLVAHPEGTRIFRGLRRGKPEEAAVLGTALAEELLHQGAEEVLDQVTRSLRAEQRT